MTRPDPMLPGSPQQVGPETPSELERAYLRHAEECLEEMRRRSELWDVPVAHAGAGWALWDARQERWHELAHDGHPAFFGRYDRVDDTTWYVPSASPSRRPPRGR